MTPCKILIHPFDATRDLQPLVEIWQEAAGRAHGFLGAKRLGEHRGLIEDIWLPAAETHVAWREGRRAGFVSLLGDVVGGLFVAPRHQGCGVGRALLEHALAPRAALELEVYLDNPQACAFYARLGFHEIGRSPAAGEGQPFGRARLRKTRG